MRTTYVFGHKIPDTDTVCASISLSYLKNKLGLKCEPRVLGPLNKETKFVLDYFNVPEPLFLNDVKVQMKNMEYNRELMVDEKSSIFRTYRILEENGVTGAPLVDKDKKLVGYINVKGIAKFLIDGDINYLNTSYDNIIETLGAKGVVRVDEEIEGNILAAAYKSKTFITRINLRTSDILVVGDRYEIQEYAIDSKIKLLLIVNNSELAPELVEKAKKNKVNVIKVPLGTYKCANMIKLCNYIGLFNLTKTPVTFYSSDFRDDFLVLAHKHGHTNYPIIDKKGVCLGMMRIVDSNKYDKRPVILVDHNQPSQSVDGIEEANIIEVIDHHNLGTLGTAMPINFRSMPVGCTCTIIYKMYQENNVEIPKDMAGIMLSSILSDTLLFKSPTTTDMDIEVGKELAKIADVDIEDYGYKMFKAASSVAGMSIEDIINFDMKKYKYENSYLAIGQVMTMDFDEISKRKDEIIESLNDMCKHGDCAMAMLFITDVIKNGSYVYFNEGAEENIELAYGTEAVQGMYMDDIVSRKKQMLPPLLENE